MRRKLTTDKFKVKCLKTHGLKYVYDKVVYVGSNTKVIITCPKHGDFEQTPSRHCRSKGCLKCANEAKAKAQTKTPAQFKADLEKEHGDKISCNSADYVGSITKMSFECKECGHSWDTTPSNVLSGSGCLKCANEAQTKTPAQFKADLKEVHGDKISCNSADYVGSTTKMSFECNECGHSWLAKPNGILRGKGCPSCANHGFDPSKSATLYYLEIYNGLAYKIGITNNSVEKRFSISELEHIKVLKEWHYENGQEAYDEEQKIIKEHKDAKYQGDNLLDSGNTELFDRNILGL